VCYKGVAAVTGKMKGDKLKFTWGLLAEEREATRYLNKKRGSWEISSKRIPGVTWPTERKEFPRGGTRCRPLGV